MPVVGQVYRSCDPRGGPTVRIIQIHPNSATVVDAVTGKRPRDILLDTLHGSATTRTGQPRRTGYALEQQ